MVNKENYSYKVDIYALGCIIYELFTLKEYYERKFGDYKKINSDVYNSKWQYLINFLLNSDYNNRPDIEDIYNFIINKTPLNIINEDTLINKIIQIENNVIFLILMVINQMDGQKMEKEEEKNIFLL